MSEKKGIWKFVNLFDIIVTAIVIVAAAALIFIGRATSAPGETATASTVEYVMLLSKMQNGSEDLVKPGDKVMDKIKKYEMGSVVSVEVTDAYDMAKNLEDGMSGSAKHVSGKDAYVTVTSPCTESERAITVGGGFEVRIGEPISVQGPGWHGSGYIVDITR